jgi:hypothetical protein
LSSLCLLVDGDVHDAFELRSSLLMGPKILSIPGLQYVHHAGGVFVWSETGMPNNQRALRGPVNHQILHTSKANWCKMEAASGEQSQCMLVPMPKLTCPWYLKFKVYIEAEGL